MPPQFLHLLLVPDRSAAWKVRRAVAETAPMLGVRIVTWPELAEALRSLFLLPGPKTSFAERLAEAAAGVADATRELDGSRCEYLLQVPPFVRSAREAVARTFGLTEEEYQPEMER